MARAIAVTILLAVLAPSFLVFASSPSSAPEDNLPACCRRDGNHHCAMMVAPERATAEHQFGSIPAKCPFRDSVINASRAAAFVPTATTAAYAGLVSHPAHYEQAFANGRVSEARSHQKRGPPSFLGS